MSAEPIQREWQARLALRFVRSGQRTVRGPGERIGPLAVQRSFHPEGPALCHSYLLHPPGGLVNGDRLEIDVLAEPETQVLITTPSAGKLYRSLGPEAELHQRMQVAAGASLEWLPQENIVFDGAKASIDTTIDLADDARFIGWEITCLGRQSGAQPFNLGQLQQRLRLTRDGKPLLIERGRVTGNKVPGSLLPALHGWQGRTVYAQLIATLESPNEDLLETLRTLPAGPQGQFTVTAMDGLLIGRYLGHSGETARRCFEQAWTLLRPAVLQRPACRPRIWNT